eukprot:2180444-Prymnesium_polylepis.3
MTCLPRPAHQNRIRRRVGRSPCDRVSEGLRRCARVGPAARFREQSRRRPPRAQELLVRGAS